MITLMLMLFYCKDLEGQQEQRNSNSLGKQRGEGQEKDEYSISKHSIQGLMSLHAFLTKSFWRIHVVKQETLEEEDSS